MEIVLNFIQLANILFIVWTFEETYRRAEDEKYKTPNSFSPFHRSSQDIGQKIKNNLRY